MGEKGEPNSWDRQWQYTKALDRQVDTERDRDCAKRWRAAAAAKGVI